MKHRNEKKFFLHDPDQEIFRSESVQHYFDGTMNPCQESTYNFLETVVKYLKKTESYLIFLMKKVMIFQNFF